MWMKLSKSLNAFIIKCYNWSIRIHIFGTNNKFARRIRAMLYHNICYECEATFGRKNPERYFYVIRSSDDALGFMGIYNRVVENLKIAEKRGLEPVVDWQYYFNSSIMSNSTLGRKNAWDDFFLPISDVTLDEVYKSKNVVMSSGDVWIDAAEVYDEEKLLHSSKLIEKYMRPNERIVALFEKKKSELSMNSGKILGILCRGTDFVSTCPSKHAIVPTTEQMIEIIEKKMIEWEHYNYIFVATEDRTILKALKGYYGDRLLVNQRTMPNYTDAGGWLNELYLREKENGIKISTEYFISILLLCECNAFIAPLVGGTLGVLRISGGMDRVYITQLGLYD